MEKNSEKSLKKDNFIFDTSAFLSLESVYLLDKILNLYNIITTESVIKELENFAQYEDELGLIARRVTQKKNQFLLKEIKVSEKLYYVSDTDNELYNLSKKEDIALITDDIKLSYHTTDIIEIKFSTRFLANFVKAGSLTKSEALEKLEKMRNIRNWQDNIVYLTTRQELEGL